MKFKDFEQVKELRKKLENLNKALEQSKKLCDHYKEHSREVTWCYISEHQDGSGKNINLIGCCLGGKVAKSVSILVKEEIEITKTELIELGIIF